MRSNMVYHHQLMKNPVMNTSHELSYSPGVVLQETTGQSSCTLSAMIMGGETMSSVCDHGGAAAAGKPASGGSCTPRPRWCPTPEQIQVLEALFHSGTTTPSRDMIVEIVACLRQFGSIVEANVFYWFQNRKARAKRKLRLQKAAAAQQATKQQVSSASAGAGAVEQPYQASSTPNGTEKIANLTSQFYLKSRSPSPPSSSTEHVDQEPRPLHTNHYSHDVNKCYYYADPCGMNISMPPVHVSYQRKPSAFAEMSTMSRHCISCPINMDTSGAHTTSEEEISITPALLMLSSTYNPQMLLHGTHADLGRTGHPGSQPVTSNNQTHQVTELNTQLSPIAASSFKSMSSYIHPVMPSAVMSPSGSAGNSGDMVNSCCSNTQGHSTAAGTTLELSGTQRCRSSTISQYQESNMLPAVINKPCQIKQNDDYQLLADHVSKGVSQDAPYPFNNSTNSAIYHHRHQYGLAGAGIFQTHVNLEYLEASASSARRGAFRDITQCTLLSCDQNMQPRAVQQVQVTAPTAPSHAKANDALIPASFYSVSGHNVETDANILPLSPVGSVTASDILDGPFESNIKQQYASPSVANNMHALHDQPALNAYNTIGASTSYSPTRCHHLPLWEALAPYMSIGS